MEYTDCLHCGLPILDDECFMVSTKDGHGHIHVQCHDNFKRDSAKRKIDLAFINCYNDIYNENEDSTQTVVQGKWRSKDNTEYDSKKLKAHRSVFDEKGPNGKMINDLSRNFARHPNTIRMLWKTIFRYPNFKQKALTGLQNAENTEMTFDLLLLETIDCLLENESLIGDKMSMMLLNLDNEKGTKAVMNLLKQRILVPSRLFDNSVVTRIIKHSEIDVAFNACLMLPKGLIWNPDIILDRMSTEDIERFIKNKQLATLIENASSNLPVWTAFAKTLFARPVIFRNADLRKMIRDKTIELIEKGDFELSLIRYDDIQWGERITWVIKALGIRQYDFLDYLQEIKQMCLGQSIWSQDCSHAMFMVSDPDVYEALVGEETFFDE